MDFPVPENERERVKAVDSYHIIGTPPEPAFDDVAELAAQILDCPVGIINFISDTREWLKAKYGVNAAGNHLLDHPLPERSLGRAGSARR